MCMLLQQLKGNMPEFSEEAKQALFPKLNRFKVNMFVVTYCSDPAALETVLDEVVRPILAEDIMVKDAIVRALRGIASRLGAGESVMGGGLVHG